MATVRVDAVLPAAGRLTGSFAREAGAEVKALTEIVGTTMLERAIGCLRASGCVDRIAVVGPVEVCAHPAAKEADACVPAVGDGIENVLSGIDALGGDGERRVLVMTTDLPFVAPEHVADMVDRCREPAAACVPVIERARFEARFPESPNFYVRMRDGQWTIGCCFVVDQRALQANRERLRRVFAARKSAPAMARLLGPAFVLRWVLGLATVDSTERRCSRMLGCHGRAIRGCAPELAFDIDLVEEYRYAVRQFAPASPGTRMERFDGG